MRVILGKDFKFESAHYIPGHEKCGEYHGHTYNLKVKVSGQVVPKTGMVMDLHDLSQLVHKIIDQYDHRSLNDFHEMPTCEHLAGSIFLDLYQELPIGVRLESITVQEGVGGFATYTGEDLICNIL